MARFRELSTFLAVAEEGAFNAAARRLHISPPAVTRLVTALETRLGVRLFNRTTRQVVLTEAGTRLRADAARVLADLEEAEASAAGDHDAPRGNLQMTAPVLFGQHFIAPIVRDYLDRFPNVTASLVFVDRMVDLIDEGLDVGVRIGELPDSSLTALKVGHVRRVVVASPDYLAQFGIPPDPNALKHHRIIDPTATGDSGSIWVFEGDGGRHAVRLAPALKINTMAAAIDAALNGWGISRVLSYQVASNIAGGELVEILKSHEMRQMPIHLVHHEGRRAAAKIRTFVDMAAARLRAQVDEFDASVA